MQNRYSQSWVAMKSRRVRIGIDVGGTFTKAVLIDDETNEIIGKSTTLTTHYAPEGVAKGVIQVFSDALTKYKVKPENVIFLAHSTTQATNALLEGDVVPVGIIGMGKGRAEGFLVKRETKLGKFEIAPGRVLKTYSKFIDSSQVNSDTTKQVIQDLVSQGAKAIVATEAFGVDKPQNENLVMKSATDVGIPATAAHEISKLYGLTIRTRTGVINASILPKMMETANMTEDSMRKTGIKAPLMIMRGDGGVMEVDEMRKRPIITMLSGPSASVAGALMYLKVSDGIFFEVGGTSTNIGVIKNGKPMVKYVEVGKHQTFVHSLDVRVRGIAGGSMVRLEGKKIVDVGPRSAHIAGLAYAAFVNPKQIKNPEIVLIQPRQGDPHDYVAVKVANGDTYAITNTCAANVLGLTKPGDYAHGNPEAARKAIDALAHRLGLTIEETARRILETSSAKVTRVVDQLIEDYKLIKEDITLVGGGGGAAALIPFAAKKLGMEYKISENAEVISSIGVALAMVREMVERTVPNPTPDIILAIKSEAKLAAIASGAAPATVQVFIEIDPQKNRVRAVAIGSTELRAKDLRRKVTLEEAKSIAAKALHLPSEIIVSISGDIGMFILSAEVGKKRFGLFTSTRKAVVVVDKLGFIKLKRSRGAVLKKSSVRDSKADLKDIWHKATRWEAETPLPPDVFVIVSGILADFSGVVSLDQAEILIDSELQGLPPEKEIVIIGLRSSE